jgi:HTH-type transcriptional regulator/antitoxin HigA
MMTERYITSDLAIFPGEYLEEVIEEMGLNQAELARRMGRPPQAINEIIKGEKAITPDTSIQLEKVLGVPAHIWINLESEYQLVRANQLELEGSEKEVPLLADFPYLDLKKLNLVENTRNKVAKVQSLRRFFGVASLFNLVGVRQYAPAFRQVAKEETNHNALAAWLRAGTLLSQGQSSIPCNKDALRNKLDGIRALTLEVNPEVFLPELKSILNECGVCLVLIPCFPKTYTTGATFRGSQDEAIILMTMRGSYADIFWLSIFHELGHILLHDKRVTFLENKCSDQKWKIQEDEADSFSKAALIPSNRLEEFILGADFSDTSIVKFANRIGIAVGIVTGRLQHEGVLPYTRQVGRIRYKWK